MCREDLARKILWIQLRTYNNPKVMNTDLDESNHARGTTFFMV